jgi:TRAP-type transport system small permease protein
MKASDSTWFARCDRLTTRVSEWFERVGLVAIAAMGLTTLIDVIGSKVLNRPLPGSTEIIGIIQIAAIAGGLAFSKIAGSQIRVDLLPDLLPELGKAILDLFGSLLGLGFMVVASWMSWKHGLSLLDSGTKTFLLGVPLFPFSFWIALGCLLTCFVILLELIASLKRILR